MLRSCQAIWIGIDQKPAPRFGLQVEDHGDSLCSHAIFMKFRASTIASIALDFEAAPPKNVLKIQSHLFLTDDIPSWCTVLNLEFLSAYCGFLP